MSRRAVEQESLLVTQASALERANRQADLMYRAADADSLRQALKHACGMLQELRTNKLSPQTYFQLYMEVFSHLGFLESFLDRVRASGTPARELYNMVQHAEHVLTRLCVAYDSRRSHGMIVRYLLVTVGSLFIRSKEEPAQEILFDTLDMVKGVQHPTRGLFLRYYLVQMYKDKLPDAGSSDSEGEVGATVGDALHFLLSNFTEMSRLWVRLQHPSYSKNKKRRERERRELREAVGFCLECISNLEGVDESRFREQVLPAILAQVEESGDPMAQRYLMEVAVQSFPVPFVVRTLPTYLKGLPHIATSIDLPALLSALCDRLESEVHVTRDTQFTAADLPQEPPTEQQQQQGEGEGEEAETAAGGEPRPEYRMSCSTTDDLSSIGILAAHMEAALRHKIRHVKDTTVAQVYERLLCLSDRVFPGDLTRLNRMLESCEATLQHANLTDDGKRAVNRLLSSLYRTLSLPLDGVLGLPGFNRLRTLLSPVYRRSCANGILDAALEQQLPLSSEVICRRFFRAISPLIRDENGSMAAAEEDPELFSMEQRKVARAVHLLGQGADSFETEQKIFVVAREAFGHGGAPRILHTLPPLVMVCLMFVQRLLQRISEESAAEPAEEGESAGGGANDSSGGSPASSREERSSPGGSKSGGRLRDMVKKMFQFVHKTCTGLATSHPESALRLFLQCARVARFAHFSVEFIAQAYILYEDIADSRRQKRALIEIIAALRHCGSRGMGTENYLSQATRATQYSTKLLRKPDQVICLLRCAHLFWLDEEEGGSEETRRPREVLQCLQRALQVADTCMPPDPHLFPDILDAYVFFFEKRVPTIQPSYIGTLVDLVLENGQAMQPGPAKANVLAQHRATLSHINLHRQTPEGEALYREVQV